MLFYLLIGVVFVREHVARKELKLYIRMSDFVSNSLQKLRNSEIM